MSTRKNEWYVPKFGGERFRLFVGMTFWPMTLMNVSYTIIGSMLAPQIHWEGVGIIALVYLFGLGISAHALDARGLNKPWGKFLTDKQLLSLALVFFVLAVGLGVYYVILNHLIGIWPIGLMEIFFLFAYNMEWFGGFFHTDGWFAVSWGALPLLAGYFFQTDVVSWTPFLMCYVGFFTAYVEISASRPYRAIKLSLDSSQEDITSFKNEDTQHFAIFTSRYYERILKAIVASVTLLALALMVMRA